MSQAEDLLNSLEEPEVAAYSADTVIEPHIVINRDKTVTIPEQLKRILVQYDHNIETVTFDCPRYWDSHDLSQMDMRIMFERSDGHREPHPVENLQVDESDDSMIHFDWTISRNTTLVNGNIRITICAKITNAEGIADREWHTIPNKDLFVNGGMDCSGEEIVEQNPDIIEAILIRLDELKTAGGVSDEQIANAVEAYMAENPPAVNPDSGQNVELDTTLTESGKPADAKAVGDEIQRLDDAIANIDKPTDEQVGAAVDAFFGKTPPAAVSVDVDEDGTIVLTGGEYYDDGNEVAY